MHCVSANIIRKELGASSSVQPARHCNHLVTHVQRSRSYGMQHKIGASCCSDMYAKARHTSGHAQCKQQMKTGCCCDLYVRKAHQVSVAMHAANKRFKGRCASEPPHCKQELGCKL